DLRGLHRPRHLARALAWGAGRAPAASRRRTGCGGRADLRGWFRAARRRPRVRGRLRAGPAAAAALPAAPPRTIAAQCGLPRAGGRASVAEGGGEEHVEEELL